MKRIVFLFAVMGLTLFSCKKTNSINAVSGTLDGKWRMIMVKDNASGLITSKPLSIQGDVDIIFSSNSSTNGVLSGNTPTNEIWQSDYSTGANRTITIPCLNMTKVMETSWGKEFVDNVRNSLQYNFEPVGNLIIETLNKTLIFQKL